MCVCVALARISLFTHEYPVSNCSWLMTISVARAYGSLASSASIVCLFHCYGWNTCQFVAIAHRWTLHTSDANRANAYSILFINCNNCNAECKHQSASYCTRPPADMFRVSRLKYLGIFNSMFSFQYSMQTKRRWNIFVFLGIHRARGVTQITNKNHF